MAGDTLLAFMRNGQAQQQLKAYLLELADNDQIVEIWTLQAKKHHPLELSAFLNAVKTLRRCE